MDSKSTQNRLRFPSENTRFELKLFYLYIFTIIMYNMRVQKRNGEFEEVSFDKPTYPIPTIVIFKFKIPFEKFSISI